MAPAKTAIFAENELSPAFWRTFWLLAALAVLPFWVGEYMPLVDIPQHAAQLSISQHWDDPLYHYQDYYQINWFASQLVAHGITRVVASIMPLVPAIKLVLSMSVVCLGLSALFLARTVRCDPWWTLLAFPLGFSFSMYWGFYNYVVAVPLGVMLIALAVRYALVPNLKRGLVMMLSANVLFICHAFILGFTGLCSLLVILLRAEGRRTKLMGALSLASVLPTVALWWHLVRTHQPSTTPTPVRWHLGLHRVLEFFTLQVGSEVETWQESAVGVGILALPFLFGARPTRELWRWVPFIVTALAFALVPLSAIEVDLLYGRLAVFALPSLLLALDTPLGSTLMARSAVVALVAFQLVYVTRQFARFDAEASSLDLVLQAAQSRKRVLYMPAKPESEFTSGGPYNHFGSWYIVRHGGTVDFSFAEFMAMRFRYKEHMLPHLPDEFDSHLDEFHWNQHGGANYDYFLVRGSVRSRWFAGAEHPVVQVAQSGDWTLLSDKPQLAGKSAQ